MRHRLSFANVTSMLALFVALGGTSYAAVTLSANSVTKGHLRTNSVGKSEIRTNAVGRAEVASSAVSSSEIRNSGVGTVDVRDESLALEDLAPAARTSLGDLNGVTFRAGATAAGALAGGNARSVSTRRQRRLHGRAGPRRQRLPVLRRRRGCQTGTTIEAPPAGLATAEPSATNTQVIVKTYNPAGTLTDAPFNLLVAC